MDAKKNVPLIVGLSIPVLMIIFVAASIYLPGLFVQPKVNFLYSLGGDYYSKSKYYVLDDKIALGQIAYPEKGNTGRWVESRREPKLYFHDVVKNQNKEISFEEAQTLALDHNVKSPDGFEITRGEYSYSIFEILTTRGHSWGTRYITGHNVSKKLNIPDRDDSYGYYGDFQFLGWAIERYP